MKSSRCYEALGALDIYIAHAHMRACVHVPEDSSACDQRATSSQPTVVNLTQVIVQS